jgi:hypothetical protein
MRTMRTIVLAGLASLPAVRLQGFSFWGLLLAPAERLRTFSFLELLSLSS